MKEKKVTLKNGVIITLKSVSETEAPLVLNFLKSVISDTPTLSHTPAEINALDAKTERAILLEYEKSKVRIMVGAYLDGKIIANCTVSEISNKAKYRHRGEIGISVIREYWNLGIGSALMQTAFDFATRVGYEQLELEIAESNMNGIVLYDKFGFKTVGFAPRAQKFNGQYIDFLRYVKYLREEKTEVGKPAKAESKAPDDSSDKSEGWKTDNSEDKKE